MISIILLTDGERAKVEEIQRRIDTLNQEIKGRIYQEERQKQALVNLLQEIGAKGSKLYLKWREEQEDHFQQSAGIRWSGPTYTPILSENGLAIVIQENEGKDRNDYYSQIKTKKPIHHR